VLPFQDEICASKDLRAAVSLLCHCCVTLQVDGQGVVVLLLHVFYSGITPKLQVETISSISTVMAAVADRSCQESVLICKLCIADEVDTRSSPSCWHQIDLRYCSYHCSTGGYSVLAFDRIWWRRLLSALSPLLETTIVH